MKTIKQLWDETPQGESIKDPLYLKLCDYVSNKTARSIIKIAYVIPDFWNMNCAVAIANVDVCVEKQNKINPNWLNEYRNEQFKRFLNS